MPLTKCYKSLTQFIYAKPLWLNTLPLASEKKTTTDHISHAKAQVYNPSLLLLSSDFWISFIQASIHV